MGITSNGPTTEIGSSAVSERILEALRGIRYGSVEIIIHDGRIVQIERKEKWRQELELSIPTR
jgi:hypothetical protein